MKKQVDYTYKIYIENVTDYEKEKFENLLKAICNITGFNSSFSLKEDWE